MQLSGCGKTEERTQPPQAVIPSWEEVAESLPRFSETSEYRDLNERLADEFLQDVYKPVYEENRRRGFYDPLTGPFPPVQIDGVIAGMDEVGLWNSLLFIALRQLRKHPGQFDEQLYMQALTGLARRLRPEMAIKDSLPRMVLDLLIPLLEACRTDAKPYEIVLLDYALAEMNSCLETGKMAILTHPLLYFPDLSDDGTFKKFLEERTPLEDNPFEAMSGTPIDYLPARQAGAPTMVVFLDIHTNASINWSEIHDLPLLSPYHPLLGYEGIPYEGKKWEKPFASTQDYLRYLVDSFDSLEEKLQAIVDSKSSFGAVPVESDFTEEELAGLNQANMRRIEGRLSALRSQRERIRQEMESFPSGSEKADFESRKKALGELMNFVEERHLPINGPILAGNLLYKGQMVFHGYEDDGLMDLVAGLEIMVEGLSIGIVTGNLLQSLRSRSALENMMTMMQVHANPLGVFVMGAGHYASLRDQAERLENVNLIFVRPNPYSGDLPP